MRRVDSQNGNIATIESVPFSDGLTGGQTYAETPVEVTFYSGGIGLDNITSGTLLWKARREENHLVNSFPVYIQADDGRVQITMEVANQIFQWHLYR